MKKAKREWHDRFLFEYILSWLEVREFCFLRSVAKNWRDAVPPFCFVRGHVPLKYSRHIQRAEVLVNAPLACPNLVQISLKQKCTLSVCLPVWPATLTRIDQPLLPISELDAAHKTLEFLGIVEVTGPEDIEILASLGNKLQKLTLYLKRDVPLESVFSLPHIKTLHVYVGLFFQKANDYIHSRKGVKSVEYERDETMTWNVTALRTSKKKWLSHVRMPSLHDLSLSSMRVSKKFVEQMCITFPLTFIAFQCMHIDRELIDYLLFSLSFQSLYAVYFTSVTLPLESIASFPRKTRFSFKIKTGEIATYKDFMALALKKHQNDTYRI